MIAIEYTFYVPLTEDLNGERISASAKDKFATFLSSKCRELGIPGFAIIPDCKNYWDSGKYMVEDDMLIVKHVHTPIEVDSDGTMRELAKSIKSYFYIGEVLITKTTISAEYVNE